MTELSRFMISLISSQRAMLCGVNCTGLSYPGSLPSQLPSPPRNHPRRPRRPLPQDGTPCYTVVLVICYPELDFSCYSLRKFGISSNSSRWPPARTPPVRLPTFRYILVSTPEIRVLMACSVARIKKVARTNGKTQTKFKVRCTRYLYTLSLDDPEKAEKLKHSLPPGTQCYYS